MKGLVAKLKQPLVLAALSLPALLFFPHAKNAFWAAEYFSTLLLIPPAALLAARYKPAPGPNQAGISLFLILAGLWFLSSAFAFRSDLAARELAGWLCLPLAWIIGNHWAATPERRKRLLSLLLATGALQALYGIAQSAGAEPILAKSVGRLAQAFGLPSFGFESLNWAVTFGGRAGGFLGNPNFLGGHMALLLPLSVALALNSRNQGWLGWAAAALCAGGLVVSQTRGAWLGGAFGLGLTLWLCHRRMPGLLWRNRKQLGALGLAGLAAVAIFFASHTQNIKRLGSLFSGDEEISRRITLMKASLHLVAGHPLLGVGPGNFRIFFPTVQKTALGQGFDLNQTYIYSEHSHNDLIQMAVDCGLPAALLFALLVAWAFRRLLRLGRVVEGIQVDRQESAGDPLLALGVFGSLAALAVHGLANFPFLILPTQATAWALAGLALNLDEKEQEGGAPARWKAGLLLAGLAWAFCAYHAGRNLHKDALWWVGQGEESLGHHAKARDILFKALEIDRREDRLWHQHAATNLGDNLPFNAVGSLKAAVKENPNFVEARVALGQAEIQLSQWSEAAGHLSPVAQIAPNYAPLWEPLAAALYMSGKYEEAVNAYDWALLYNPPNAAELLDNKAACLGNLGHYEAALSVLEKSEAQNPTRAKTLINKAITYYKMGMKPQARENLKKAKFFAPNDPQISDLEKAMR